MAGVPKFYKNNIAEGRGILVFAILVSIVVRIVYFLNFDYTASSTLQGYLWKPLESFISLPIVSLLVSSAVVAGLAILSRHLNTTFVLIRKRTVLPPAIVLLLFSCHPALIYMSPAYVGVLAMFLIVSILFGAYGEPQGSHIAFRVSFILALGSLFTPVLLLYLPIVWIGLGIMRCISFKSLLASVFGLFVTYFPAFSFFLFTDSLDAFLEPFRYDIRMISDLPLFNLDLYAWIAVGVWILLLILIMADNYINRHKDKIRVRAYLSLLSFITIIAFLAYLFFHYSPEEDFYIMLGMGSILLAHFFALAESKATVILFYICLIFYLAVCIAPFFNLL